MKRQKVIELDCAEEKKINIDWEDVSDEEEVPELEIIGTDKTPSTNSGDDSAVSVRSLSDYELDNQLKRQRSLLASFSEKLPDKAKKIRIKIGDLEYEKQCRMFSRTKKDADKCQSSNVRPISSANTASKDTSRQGNTGLEDVSRSIFSARSNEKPKMDAQPVKLFNEERQDLGRGSWKTKADKETITKPSNGLRLMADKETTTKPSNGWRSMPRLDKCQTIENNFYSGVKEPKGNPKHNEASVKRKPKDSSPYLLLDDDDDDDNVIGYETPREWSLKASPSQSSSCWKKSNDNVINLDEEEPLSPMVVEEEAVELPEGLPEDICFPYRDDPDLVQVSLKDLNCLLPQEYLKSPVINFYIRYLQHQMFSENQTAPECHFFNTFFYKKLIEAVSYKGNDKDAFFIKFRRWWKGYDLFRKSYIFIPIHEDVHWSLVIICIPDKEDESGLTIIHLDSLGLHPRKIIFDNIKKFLTEEWNYLNQDAPLSDLPISEKIWRDLPNRINEAVVQVPQQKNDFDCGLFVIFFMERFIKEAPERLKLKDLGMIHKKWFKPEEASALRVKIWNKLVDLFRNSIQTD